MLSSRREKSPATTTRSALVVTPSHTKSYIKLSKGMHHECGVKLAPFWKAHASMSRAAHGVKASAPTKVPSGKVFPLLLFPFSSKRGATMICFCLQTAKPERMMLAKACGVHSVPYGNWNRHPSTIPTPLKMKLEGGGDP